MLKLPNVKLANVLWLILPWVDPDSVVLIKRNSLLVSFQINAWLTNVPRLNTKPKSYELVPVKALFNTINGSLMNVLVLATVVI